MGHLEHIGIAVHDAATVAHVYADLFGISPYKQETVTSEHVRTHFIQVGQTKLELLESLDPSSAIASFLGKRGEGLHHLAFEVENLPAEIERLQALGYQPLNLTPKPGADSKHIAFLHPKQTHRVLIELCERVERALPTVGIPYGSGSLHTYRSGNHAGTPLLALSRPGHTLEDELAPVLNHFEKHVSVIASTVPADADLREVINTVLMHYEIDQTYVFAYSTGAHLALEYAAQYPERVAKLVLHAPRQTASSQELPTTDKAVLLSGMDNDPQVSLDDLIALHRALPKSQLAILPGDTNALNALDLPSYERIVHRFLAE